jgi:hypothetical protein
LKRSGNQCEPREHALPGTMRIGWYGEGSVPPGSPNPRWDILLRRKGHTVGLRDLLRRRRRKPSAAGTTAAVRRAAAEHVPLTPAQLADLEEARAELRQAAEETGVTSFRAAHGTEPIGGMTRRPYAP